MDEQQNLLQMVMDNAQAKVHVAMPASIVSFDPATQTATVQPSIQENVKMEGEDRRPETLPQIPDVPCYYPRAAQYSITIPIKEGDECLLVFADRCIDGWWQSGGVQKQVESRNHDLSDAFALIGFTSNPRAIEEYSTDSIRIRNEDNKTYIDLKDNHIQVQNVDFDTSTEIKDDVVTAVARQVNVTAREKVDVTAPVSHFHGNIIVDGEATISGIAFTPHTHSKVMEGGGSSGPPEG